MTSEDANRKWADRAILSCADIVPEKHVALYSQHQMNAGH
jgi:hypothetical protein